MSASSVVEPPRNLRLLTVTASVSRRAGGLFHSVRRLSQAVSARGVPVEVISLRDADTASDLPFWKPLCPHVFRSGPALGYSRDLRRAIEQFADDRAVCHLHGIWLYPSKATRDVARRTRMPRVISPRGMLDPWALTVSAWKKKVAMALFERQSLKSADCLHALCDSEFESLRRLGLTNPIAVVANGTDLPPRSEAPLADPAPGDWRGCNILLFLGRIHPKKGILPLIEGWARSKDSAREWRLAIAGPNEVGHREEVQSRIDELGMGELIRIVGPQFGRAKDAWLRRAGGFVLTSHSEGFPMAVLEAMAYGLPVLLSPTCNFPQAVSHAAAIETTVDAESISQALRTFFAMTGPELQAMGERGNNLVTSEYTWDRIAGQMIDVYSWLRGVGDRPDCVRVD